MPSAFWQKDVRQKTQAEGVDVLTVHFYTPIRNAVFEAGQRGSNSTSDPMPNFAGSGMFDHTGSSPMRNCQRPLSEKLCSRLVMLCGIGS